MIKRIRKWIDAKLYALMHKIPKLNAEVPQPKTRRSDAAAKAVSLSQSSLNMGVPIMPRMPTAMYAPEAQRRQADSSNETDILLSVAALHALDNHTHLSNSSTCERQTSEEPKPEVFTGKLGSFDGGGSSGDWVETDKSEIVANTDKTQSSVVMSQSDPEPETSKDTGGWSWGSSGDSSSYSSSDSSSYSSSDSSSSGGMD